MKIVVYVSMLMLFCLSCASKESSQNYKIQLTVYPANAGTVTGDNGTLKIGEKANITATANPGYVFSNWQVAGTSNVFSTEAVHGWVVNKDVSLIAVFKKESENSLIDIFEQQKLDIVANYGMGGASLPKNVLQLRTRYIGDDFLHNGISRENSGVVNDNGNVHMVINTKDLLRRGLYKEITGGGPHMWMSKDFERGVFPWSKKGDYLRFKIDAAVPFVRLEDPNGNTGNTNFKSNKAPVTQLCFGFYLRDNQSGITFAYIIALYESRGTYKETANANDTFVNFVSTPVETSSKFITVPASSTLLQSVPFSDKRNFEVQIKRENIEKVIAASNALLSTDLTKYELTMAGLMFELPNYVLNGHNTSEVMVSNFQVSIEKE